jgi:DNA polymerase V
MNMTLEVLDRREQDYVELPLYLWSVAAGQPVPADNTVERTVRIVSDLVPNPAKSYLLRVVGDSMEKAHIFAGDLIVVDHSMEPRHNSIIVASLNGEMTVKRLHQVGKKILLLPENEKYAPIVVGEFDAFVIHGVVTGCFRPVQ